MKSHLQTLNIRVLGLLLAFVAGASDNAAAEVVREGLVLDHVIVVDVRTGQLVPDRAVVVAHGKFVEVVRAGTVQVVGSARLVQGKGRFVVPGFNDMHAHNLNTDSPATSLPLMLANGVTGFRQMAGSPELLAARAIGKTTLPPDSPALLAMPGAILAGAGFADPVAAVAEITRQKAQGADFIKVIDLPPPAFLAAADAARDSGLPFAGHLSVALDAREAMRHGMASIEHLGPGITLLLSCSRDETAVRAVLASLPPGSGGSNFNADPEQLRRMLANPLLLTPPQGFALMHRVIASYDEDKCRAFAAEVAASSTWMVPTLTRLEAMERGNTPALRDNPDLRYAPAGSRTLWRQVGSDFEEKLTPDQRQLLESLFESQLRLTGLFDKAGVKMLTGTDFGGQWILPGFSLHHEFDLLARAGVSPLRVLQMTTIDPARFLKREATMGTVEPGKKADLVILDADPTKAVANLHRVSAVMHDGRLLSRTELDKIEERARASLL